MSFVEKDLRGLLLLRGTTTASNTFIGPVRKAGPFIPDQAIFIRTQGGLNPNEYLDGRNGVSTYRIVDAKVRVRSPVNQYDTGSTLAESAWRSMQACSVASLSTASTQYVRVTCFESAPYYLGINDQEQDEWEFTVRAEFKKIDASLLTEAGDLFITEDGDFLLTEF